MVRDLDAIFGATRPDAAPADYARVVVDENVLGKRTAAARKHTLNNLVNLYAMDPGVPVFRIFRDLWAIRTLQIRRGAAPELANAAFYDFRNS